MNSEIKLKYCIKVQKGKLPSSLTDKNISNYPIYLTMDYLRGNTSDLKFVNNPNDGIRAHEDDILILWDGSNAGEILEAKKGVISSTTALITPKNEIDKRFLFFLLKSNESYFKDMSIGMGIPHVNPQELLNSSFLIPSLKKQSAISAYLDQKTTEIDQLIADKEELLKLYEEEKTAVINDLVTGKKVWNGNAWTEPVEARDSGIEWLGEIPEHWEVKRFKYFFELITEKIEEDLPKIGLENIESHTGNFIETNSDFAGTGIRFRKKDILFGKLRPYLAKVWIANFEGQAVGDFYVFRSKENVLPEYGKLRILDSSFIEITNMSTYGAKMPRVSWDFIADLTIALPPINEQQSIVDFIESETTRIDTKIEDTQKLIELLKEYRTALISEIVTGKVKVIQD